MNHPAFNITALCLSCVALLVSIFLLLDNGTKVTKSEPVNEETIMPKQQKLIEDLINEAVQRHSAEKVDRDAGKLLKKHNIIAKNTNDIPA